MQIKLPNVAPEGYNLITIFAVITVILLIISIPLGLIGIALTIWCVSFFRDPDRVTPQHESLVIAPADGKVIKVEKVIPPSDMGIDYEMLKIVIFMNVFNVHVNRSPCAGTVDKITYISGKFFNAAVDKASEENERQAFFMTTKTGHQIAFVQIAGLIARRIVKFIPENIVLKAGEKIGLIKFGSRVDIYLPADTTPLVHEGQTTLAGETIIADLNYKEEVMLTEVLGRAKAQ